MFKSHPCRVNGETLGGEIGLILGHDVVSGLFGVVQVAGLPFDRQTCGGKLLQREVKESLIVGLEVEHTARLEQAAVDL